MKDLKISYDNENGEKIYREYNTIIDFIDEIKSNNIDIPMMDYENVEACFFESALQIKYFDTIEDLYDYCNIIVK